MPNIGAFDLSLESSELHSYIQRGIVLDSSPVRRLGELSKVWRLRPGMPATRSFDG